MFLRNTTRRAFGEVLHRTRVLSSDKPVQSRIYKNGAKGIGLFNSDGSLIKGTLIEACGTKRTGEFTEGNMTVGKVELPDGRTYMGAFEKGVPVGEHVLSEDGFMYTGELNNKWQRHGKGTETHPNGQIFTGTFSDDQLSHGTVTIPETETRSEIIFEGDLQDGKFHKGTLKFNNMTYKGELRDSNPHGKGRLEMADGSVREGTFKMGVLEGMGQIILKNGTIFSGEFKDGLLPEGDVKWPNGDVYEGDLDDSHQPDGLGTMFKAAAGHYWTGTWRCGTFSGGSVTDSEGAPVDYRIEDSGLGPSPGPLPIN
eukprot:TRINITY_DN19715_c1_g1_i1.p1 TRINITY_DN19715_c1_g1~~TRINITY_DN19715_c1_g1_i1.p1  ORF type:complete len:312 (+),score=48.99 TRINITY_DN19715_c1_g1_i1:64-999(+)